MQQLLDRGTNTHARCATSLAPHLHHTQRRSTPRPSSRCPCPSCQRRTALASGRALVRLAQRRTLPRRHPHADMLMCSSQRPRHNAPTAMAPTGVPSPRQPPLPSFHKLQAPQRRTGGGCMHACARSRRSGHPTAAPRRCGCRRECVPAAPPPPPATTGAEHEAVCGLSGGGREPTKWRSVRRLAVRRPRGLHAQSFRKESQLPVHSAWPSEHTPRQLTRLSCPARQPTCLPVSVSHT